MNLSRILCVDDDSASRSHELLDSAQEQHNKLQQKAGRRRRKNPLVPLRQRVEILQCVLSNLRSLTAHSSDENEPLTDEEKRLQQFLRRMMHINETAQAERLQRDELLRFLWPARQSTVALYRLMRGVVSDSWYWQSESWRALALEVYEPRTEEFCEEIVRDTLSLIKKYTPKRAANPPGGPASIVGWRDRSTLDNEQKFVHFYAGKTYNRSDIERIVANTWATHNDPDKWRSLVFGNSIDAFFQVLHQVTPDISIVNIVERHRTETGQAIDVHFASVVFQVKTDTGYIVAMRSIKIPELDGIMQSEGCCPATNLFWNTYDIASRNADGQCEQIRIGLTGYLGSPHPVYAKWWLREVAFTLIRSDAIISYGEQPFSVVPS